MHSLRDYLLANTPLIALVEPDMRWASRIIENNIQELGDLAGPTLQWTLTEGWTGTEGMTIQTGLSKIGTYKQGEHRPIKYLSEFVSWLDSSKQQTRTGQEPPFKGGVATLYDLQGFLDHPAMGRIVMNMADQLADQGGTAIMVLPHPIPADNVAISAVVHVRPSPDPRLRYGDLAEAVVEQYSSGKEAALQIQQLCDALKGLSRASATTVLRLAALDMIERDGELRPEGFEQQVQRIRREVEAAQTGESLTNSPSTT